MTTFTPFPAHPNVPYQTDGAFGCYIVCHLPADPAQLLKRRRNFHRQLTWWMGMTDIPIHAVLSGWSGLAVASDTVLPELLARGGTYVVVDPQPLIVNRRASLEAFYKSDHDWGIVMDDDAILYDGAQHNRGPRLFAEMAANGIAAYDGVDVFFPINPQKIGFSPIYAKNPTLYTDHHVFERSIDLKGSMFVVRNFRKEGKPVVLPDLTFTLHGEDRHFALEAVSMGYSVMRCENIVLKEFSGPSHFATNRTAQMKVGYTALAERYAAHGLTMQPNSHLHDLREFWANCWGSKATKVVV